jgi:hypothetical protein
MREACEHHHHTYSHRAEPSRKHVLPSMRSVGFHCADQDPNRPSEYLKTPHSGQIPRSTPGQMTLWTWI